VGSRGSTIGGVIGGVIGAILGYFGGNTIGGAMLGSSIGMGVGSAIDPPSARMGSSQYKQQDVYYNTIAHNLPVPIVYGVNRVAGNLIWLGNISANVTQSGGGGKEGGSGGGDKNSSGQQQVEVYGDFAVALSEGEIMAVTDVFIGDKVISETEGLTYTVYLGTEIQEVDPRLWKDLGALAPAFRNTAYIAMGGNLGSYPAVPQLNCEVVGKFTEPYSWGNPALIVQDILVHPRYGIDVSSFRIDPITFTAAYSYCVDIIARSDVTSAQAAALDHPYVPPSFSTITSMSMINMLYRTMVIGGLPPGYSVGMYFPDGTQFAATDVISSNGVAVMSSSIISSMGWTEDPGGGNDPIQHFTPTSGYIVLFSDATYTTVVSNGTWPTPPGVMDFYIGTALNFVPSEPAYVYPRTADGLPGEQRYTLDYVVDNYRPVVEHLRDMLSAFGGFLTWSQGIVKLHIDRPGATIVQSFGMNDISADSFKWKRQSYRERANVVRVQYIEPGNLTMSTEEDPAVTPTKISGSTYNVPLEATQKKEYKTYRQDFVEASDIWDIERTGERRDRILNLTGIKRRSQAQRMAQYFLNKAVHCSNACTFRVGINALQAEVGDVVAVSHDIPRWHGKLFKIVEIQEAENDELTLGCLEHNEAVYNDAVGETPHGQDTLYGTSGATGGSPTNVGRLSVYERPYENTLEVAYTRVATNDLFSGVDLYVQRGAGDFIGVAQNMLSNAPTAYLTTTINTLTLVTSGPLSGWATSDPITITGVPDGYAARLYHWYENVQAEAVASMGTVILPINVTTRTTGYIRVYPSANSANDSNNRIVWWPSAWDGPYRPGDLFTMQRIPQVISPSQNWIPIERPLGGWTNAESLRIETEEIGYTTFTDSMLTGVTRGAHGTTAVQHTGIVSLGMVAWEQTIGDALTVLTTEFSDYNYATMFFAANSTYLYVGASSKFSAINIWLARNASQMIGMFGEYATGAGTWVSLMSSSFIPATDTTSGLQTSGRIFWEPPGNWAQTHETTLGGLNIGDAIDRYYVRLMRVASLCVAPPVELEMTLTNDVLAVVRKSSAYLYELTLADSGQTLTFKAISRSIGGITGESVAAPTTVYVNT